jgi:hypothetical protein
MLRFSLKFRIRSLLILVAIIALMLGLGITRQRWASNRALARYHAEYEEGALWSGRQCLDNVVEYEQRRRQFVASGNLNKAQICVENSAPFAEEARHQFEQAAYHAEMRRRYESRW